MLKLPLLPQNLLFLFAGLILVPSLIAGEPAIATGTAPRAEIQVTRFGIKPDGKPIAKASVQKAARYLRAHPGTTMVFPRGDYLFTASGATRRELFLSNTDNVNPRNVGLLLEGVKQAKIIGKGARLLFQGAILPIALLKCQDVELAGFEVDWPRPRFSQGEVIATDPGGITLRIDAKQYPYAIEKGHLVFIDQEGRDAPYYIMEFDPSIGGVAYNTGDAGCIGDGWENCPAIEVDPGVIRLLFPFKRLPKIGNSLVLWHSPRDHSGAYIEDSRNIQFSYMEIRHTSGLGILAQYSEDLHFENVNFRPTPGSGRLFSGHDDGFHFSNCKGTILVEACTFQGLMDDPINVHGTSVKVIRILNQSTLMCRFMHEQSVGLKYGDPGDEVSFLDHQTMLSRGAGRIKAIRQRTIAEFEVEFEGLIPGSVTESDALENLTWTPSVTIRKCTFDRVRARGLLLSTPKSALIEDNVFRSSGAAILIAGDANEWFESGAVKHVLIRGNRFENCLTSNYEFCNAIITIDPIIQKPGLHPFHRGIRIENNVFVTFDTPILWAMSAGGLTFKGNTVLASRDFQPWHPDRNGLTFLHCSDVEVKDNKVDPAFTRRSVHIEGGSPDTIHVSDW